MGKKFIFIFLSSPKGINSSFITSVAAVVVVIAVLTIKSEGFFNANGCS
jgi:hypothetical protein